MTRTITIVAIVLSASSCLMRSEEDAERIRAFEPFECPEPGVEVTTASGKTGLARQCVIRNGSFVYSEGGIFIVGQYENGKHAGIWRWYDKSGNVTQESDYSIDETN